MGKFRITHCEIEGLVIIEPKVYADSRGCFYETYHRLDFEGAGISCEFVQDNQSVSKKGILRGLHYQRQHPQAKLVRVIRGRVYDVAVDLRNDSKTFGKWFGIELSAENKKQLFIPRGFAHGYVTLSEEAEFYYKCTDFYCPGDEGGLRYDDPEIGIAWPDEIKNLIRVNERDANWETIPQLRNEDKCIESILEKD